MASEIGRVKDLVCGQAFIYDGVQCRIEEFPTRTSVVLRNVNFKYGQWNTKKISVREFKLIAETLRG